MRRAAEHRHLDPREPAMRRANGQARRLGDDRRVGADAAGDQPARPLALEFLVRDRGDDRLAPESLSRRARRGGAHRGDAGLHVGRAAAVQPAIALVAVERRVHHAVHADDVEVPVEHQRPPAGRADARDHVGAAGAGLLQLDAKSPRVEDAGQKGGDRPLTGRAGHEQRIAGVDADERTRQRARVAERNGAHGGSGRWCWLRG